MKKIIILFGIILGFMACQKDDVGFLITEYASYEVDSLVVKGVLDELEIINPVFQRYIDMGLPEAIVLTIAPKYINGPDYYRLNEGMPWTSTAIEGVKGTNPIRINFGEIKTQKGDVNSFLSEATVYGDGAIEIPFENSVVPGRYSISLVFSNEDYEQTREDIFTVIIEEKVEEEPTTE